MNDVHWCDSLLASLSSASYASDSYSSNVFTTPPHSQTTNQTFTPDSATAYQDVIPATIITPAGANKQPMRQALHALMDTGSSISMIHRKCLPPGCTPQRCSSRSAQTTAGAFEINQKVQLSHLTFPEFSNGLVTTLLTMFVFDAPCRYDMIVGRDWLIPNKFDINFSSHAMKWFDRSAPMKLADGVTAVPTSSYFFDDSFDDLVDESAIDEHMDQFSNQIKESKYDETTLRELVDQQSHLSPEQ